MTLLFCWACQSSCIGRHRILFKYTQRSDVSGSDQHAEPKKQKIPSNFSCHHNKILSGILESAPVTPSKSLSIIIKTCPSWQHSAASIIIFLTTSNQDVSKTRSWSNDEFCCISSQAFCGPSQEIIATSCQRRHGPQSSQCSPAKCIGKNPWNCRRRQHESCQYHGEQQWLCWNPVGGWKEIGTQPLCEPTKFCHWQCWQNTPTASHHWCAHDSACRLPLLLQESGRQKAKKVPLCTSKFHVVAVVVSQCVCEPTSLLGDSHRTRAQDLGRSNGLMLSIYHNNNHGITFDGFTMLRNSLMCTPIDYKFATSLEIPIMYNLCITTKTRRKSTVGGHCPVFIKCVLANN